MSFILSSISRYFGAASAQKPTYLLRVASHSLRPRKKEHKALVKRLWEVQQSLNNARYYGNMGLGLFLYLGLFFREVVAQSPFSMAAFAGTVCGVHQFTQRKIYSLRSEENQLFHKLREISIFNEFHILQPREKHTPQTRIAVVDPPRIPEFLAKPLFPWAAAFQNANALAQPEGFDEQPGHLPLEEGGEGKKNQ